LWGKGTTVVEVYLKPLQNSELIMSRTKPDPTLKQREQKVVIIVSSPSNGFDMMEKDLMNWSKTYKIHPYAYALPDISSLNYTRRHGFRPLLDAINTKNFMAPRGFDNHNRTDYSKVKFLIDEFRHGFNAQWMQNKDIIIGSETFNSFQDERIRQKLVNVLVKLMPWNDSRFSLYGSNDRIKVIVLYRSSRSKHFHSLWKESSSKLKLEEWIASQGQDIFSTANEFIRHGAKDIDVVDVDYIVDMKYNLTHFIACKSLNLGCNGDGLLNSVVNGTTITTATVLPTYESNIANQETIERTLQDFDCRYHFLRSDSVKFFPSELRSIFSNCKGATIDEISELKNHP